MINLDGKLLGQNSLYLYKQIAYRNISLVYYILDVMCTNHIDTKIIVLEFLKIVF